MFITLQQKKTDQKLKNLLFYSQTKFTYVSEVNEKDEPDGEGSAWFHNADSYLEGD